MNQQNLRELAKQGDPRAIAALLNHSLQSKGITAKAAVKDGCLQVVLDSEEVPNQQTLFEFVRKGINSLEPETITLVKVHGRKTGEKYPTWSQDFPLIVQNGFFVSPPDDHFNSSNNQSYEQEIEIPEHIEEESFSSSYLSMQNVEAEEALQTNGRQYLDDDDDDLEEKEEEEEEKPKASNPVMGAFNSLKSASLPVKILAGVTLLAIVALPIVLSTLSSQENTPTSAAPVAPDSPPATSTPPNTAKPSAKPPEATASKPPAPPSPAVTSTAKPTEATVSKAAVAPSPAATSPAKPTEATASKPPAPPSPAATSPAKPTEATASKPETAPSPAAVPAAKPTETPVSNPQDTSGASQPNAPKPKPIAVATKPKVATTTSPTEQSKYQGNILQQAVDKAENTGKIVQSAKSKKQWLFVAGEWQEAINLMKAVPKSHPRYQLAQKKVLEYQRYLNYAEIMIRKRR